MERLTNSDKEIPTLDDNAEYWLEAYFKLKDYEDLEEQGRLLKIPLEAYFVENNQIYKGRVNECIISTRKKPLLSIRYDENTPDVYKGYVGDDVFLTESEAESKLKESEVKPMGQWNRISVPKCKEREFSDEVLVTVETPTAKRVLKAIYVPYHHCTVEDTGFVIMPDGILDDCEYYEKESTWWVQPGWYEACDYFPDFSYAAIKDKVTAWMKLPKACDPDLESSGGEHFGK